MISVVNVKRGNLRVYLGAAPGVGKTFAMLNEGRRALERGRDVVVGYVETHGRTMTAEAIGDLEVVPRQSISYRDATFEEMDVEAIIARRPERVFVDELAHTNVPGSRNEKRWQDVEELLAAGIDVTSTLNIQHLESLNDVVERITGIKQRETIPDEIVRAAEQVELVDITPEALRRRMVHGNIYAPDKIDVSLANYFRGGNLGALRELALLWVADKVDVGLEEYRERHGITKPWETRERVIVAVTGAPGTEALIRRAARVAQRAHGELLGVHVSSDEGLAGPDSELLDQHRKLLEDVGGKFHEVAGTDVAAALVEFATAENATQLVLGASHRSRWEELLRGSVINRAVHLSGPIDVHVISHEPGGRSNSDARLVRLRRLSFSPVPPRRQLAGWLLTAAGIPLLTLVLVQLRDTTGLPTVLLAYLALVVIVSVVGGTWPALVAAVAAFLCANWFFTPPYYEWTIAEGENVVALFVFLGIALGVSRIVDTAARRATEAARARGHARTLARLAATTGEDDPVPALLESLRSALGLDSVAVLRRDGHGWVAEAEAGEPRITNPRDAETVKELNTDVVLAIDGPNIPAEDLLILNAFADQLAAVLEHGRLRVEAGRAHALADANELRGALLQAVSHDLRTPLASIKACATSLKNRDVTWSEDETAEFVTTIDAETDRLTALVGNLLDMSRVQAGVIRPSMASTPPEEVVLAAVFSLGPRAAIVDVDVPESLPEVYTDPALLERAIANVIDNAVTFSADGGRVRVEATEFGERVEVRVVDRGPGVPALDRERIFQPFQRLGDSQPGGVGLGMAVAHGFLTAMRATIEIDDTSGGGTTVLISLPVA
jgi:two-component system, OmpR family, sensor histidine kinase KdpD